MRVFSFASLTLFTASEIELETATSAHWSEAGICFTNCYRFISYAASFGGRKNSGYGRESGAEAIRDMQLRKTIWTSTARVTEDPFKIR